jgi:hypothetical protein
VLNQKFQLDRQADGVKKTYISPRLTVYGDVRAVTLAVGSATKAGDGGMAPNNKTQ